MTPAEKVAATPYSEASFIQRVVSALRRFEARSRFATSIAIAQTNTAKPIADSAMIIMSKTLGSVTKDL